MSRECFLLVTDTPGIKGFVFGTDALAEVRGASALLDRLNRRDTGEQLSRALPSGASCEVVFANGGTGQFILREVDRAGADHAATELARFYRAQTGGEMGLVWGLAAWPEGDPMSYQQAVHQAHFQMRLVRETASPSRTTALLPLMVECDSVSHLPARTRPSNWGGESLMLSEAAHGKREESRRAGASGPWAGWMKALAAAGPWPDPEHWGNLRAGDAVGLARARLRDTPPVRKDYVGLVYADGNAMGRLVQELDSPETSRDFSRIVDGGIREACHQALAKVCGREVAATRKDPNSPRALPADILLLGGDDLLVLLPADVALTFSLTVCEYFEGITRDLIHRLPTGSSREFFRKRLPQGGLTISCGVALAAAKYPFYLLLDLAEDLLKNAKKGGSEDSRRGDYWAPSYIDFHLVTGPGGADLAAVREDDYLMTSGYRRTLRPYAREELAVLCQGAELLRNEHVPRSKLQDLWEAALTRRPALAGMRARELFGRLRDDPRHHKRERKVVWQALVELRPLEDFPWCRQGDHRVTALADLVEVCNLLPPEET